MLKRISYLVMLLMCICLPLTSAAKTEEDPAWQKLDFGEFAQDNFYFNTDTIKYGLKEYGTINPNIIVYQEKQVNMYSGHVQYKFYSITQGKINIENESIQLGDQAFYTRKGKLRWVDKPEYKVWITVKPETYGYLRYQQIVAYAKAHHDELVAHTEAQQNSAPAA